MRWPVPSWRTRVYAKGAADGFMTAVALFAVLVIGWATGAFR